MNLFMDRKKHFKRNYTNQYWLVFFISIVIYSAFSASVWAATQGNIGSSSTGTVSLTVVNREFALIFGMTDVDLGTWNGSGDLSGSDDICVAVSSTIPTFLGQPRFYRLRATGDGDLGSADAFTLSNGVDQIYYRVFLTDEDSQIEMLPGNINSGNHFIGTPQYNANIAAFFGGAANPCITPNATITILVEEAELTTGAGIHTGTLTLELSAE